MNEFLELIVEHFCVKFGDPNCIVFWDIMQKNRQTHRNGGENPTPATAVGVGINGYRSLVWMAAVVQGV